MLISVIFIHSKFSTLQIIFEMPPVVIEAILGTFENILYGFFESVFISLNCSECGFNSLFQVFAVIYFFSVH